MAAQPVHNRFCWQVPHLFSDNVEKFKKITDLGQSITNFLGIFLINANDQLKPIGERFKEVSGYLGATKIFTNIASWIPDDKGDIKALDTEGCVLLKGISSLGFQLIDCFDTLSFAGKLKLVDVASVSARMGQIPVFGALCKSNFIYLKAIIGFIGAGASVLDSGFAIRNAVVNMGSKGVFIDFLSGITCRGWFKAERDTPEAQKAIKETAKEFKDISLNILKNVLKTAVVALSIFGWALHPIVGFLALTYSIVEVGRIIIKGYEEQPVAYDPRYQEAWELARGLPPV